MSTPRAGRTVLILVAVATLLGWQVAAAPAAHAQEITLSTPYPAVVVEPGTTVTLDVTVESSPSQRIDLAVQAPEGWQTTLRGGGFVIASVQAGEADVSVDVAVPPDAEGTHRLTVVAEGADGDTARLPLSLTVRGDVAGAVSLQAEYAELSGSATDTFTYSVTLRNSMPNETSFALSVAGPPGWEVEAHPTAEQRATTVTVEGGGTATVQVTADPPDNVTAGTYPIQLAVSGGGQEASAEFTAEVTGTTQIELTTPNDRLNASGGAGSATRLPLVVNNTGTAPATGVTFSASPPSGWEVTFEPESVDVPPQQAARVTAIITPADDAVTGDYVVTLTADNDGRQSSAEIRFTVETSTWWGLVGILLLVVVAAGLWYVFRTYGRR